MEIRGGKPLFGRTTVHGAKNAVLPLLACSVMTRESVTVRDCPYITDVDAMLETLRALGVAVKRNMRDITVTGYPSLSSVPSVLAGVMRSSVFMLGALLSTLGEVTLAAPGGCKIGARPMDIHLDGLKLMGADIETDGGFVTCRADKLKGADIVMKYPSVGATENLLMASVTAKGKTRLIGCAREPEVVSLAKCLVSMGARITGEGSSVITVDGVDELGGTIFTPVQDRIVCGTLLCGAALCGGRVEIENAELKSIGAAAALLSSDGCRITDNGGSVTIESGGRIRPANVSTGAYPLFPTDLQAQFTTCLCCADGASSVCETVFENRFAHVRELKKMGADICVDGRRALINGGELYATDDLEASDLRGGAGLVIAALKAKGKSVINNVGYIDRGYESIESTFKALGADIVRKSL